MAYTTIDNPELYFQTKLYSGTGSTNSVTFDGSENMQPDWVWIKARSNSDQPHALFDSVRGVNKVLYSNNNDAEDDDSSNGSLTSFNSDGFTVGGYYNRVNQSGQTFASWNWKAGGTAPAITYTVKVVSDSGNKYRFDDFGTSAVTLDLQEGGTYTFDQSDSSNSGHPLRFYTAADKSGGEYTTGVTTSGTAGSAGAKTIITVAASAPTLYYQCSSHSAMGGQANTNSTFGSSNFSGSIQSTVSANTTAGFSIVKYVGTGSSSNSTVGHGLNEKPSMIIVKNLPTVTNWVVWHKSLSSETNDYLRLDVNYAKGTTTNYWNSAAPTNQVFGVSPDGYNNNRSGENTIAYCFAEKKGYSKFGSYTGNGSTDGVFIQTGFSVSWFMIKRTDSASSWRIWDNKRDPFNVRDTSLNANETGAEYTDASVHIDFLSNGVKFRNADDNVSGASYIYIAFAESPFVTSTGIPTTAR